MFNNLIEEYNKNKGKTFYKVVTTPVYSAENRWTCDHLGPYIESTTKVWIRNEYSVRRFTLNLETFRHVLEGNCYPDRESAEWAILNLERGK